MDLLKRVALFFKKYNCEIIIFSVSLAAQLILFFILTARFGFGTEGFLMGVGDTDEHFSSAINLLKNNFLSLDGLFPETLRMPLYPAIVACALWIFKQAWVVILFQQIFASLTMVWLYRLGRIMFGAQIGFIAAIVASLDPQRLFLMVKFSPEPFFGIFLIGAIYFVYKFSLEHRYKFVLFAGILMGLAAMTRVVAFVISGTLIIFLLVAAIKWFNGENTLPWKKSILAVVIFFGAMFAILFPWGIRNYYHFGVFKFSSSSEYNLWSRHLRHYLEETNSDLDKDAARKKMENMFFADNNLKKEDFYYDYRRDLRYSGYLKEKSMEILFADPKVYGMMYARRMVAFLLDSDYAEEAIYTDQYFYPVLRKTGLTGPDILMGGRYVWVFLYFLIFLATILRFKMFKKNIWPMVLIFGWVVSSDILACMSYSAKNRMYPDYLLYMLLVFSIIQLREFYKEKWQKKSST